MESPLDKSEVYRGQDDHNLAALETLQTDWHKAQLAALLQGWYGSIDVHVTIHDGLIVHHTAEPTCRHHVQSP